MKTCFRFHFPQRKPVSVSIFPVETIITDRLLLGGSGNGNRFPFPFSATETSFRFHFPRGNRISLILYLIYGAAPHLRVFRVANLWRSTTFACI